MFRAGTLLLALALIIPASSHAATFVVDDNGTGADASIDGTCQTSGGGCTLRAAIEEANAAAGLDVIHFSGSMTIVEAGLPSITDPVRLDGEANNVTIDGATITLGGTSDGSRIARVTISNAPAGGILIGSTNVTVAGTTITGNQFFGIRVTGSGAEIGGTGDGDTNVIGGTTSGSGIEVYAPNATIVANLIGTNAAGTAANANAHGIYVNGNDADVRANLISGNGGNGIWAEAVTGLIIDGNRIGTDGAGTTALGNGGAGVLLNGTTGATINANVIAANNNGIVIQNGSSNAITNNFIGTDATATLDLGHVYAGVRITAGSSDASDHTLTNNVVAFNGTGIEIAEFGASADRNRLSGNRVFGNDQIGVDLQSLSAGSGSTPNDAGDADTGANELQNYPAINCISGDGSSTTFAGSLNSAPNTTYRVEIFSNDSCESSAGKTYLGFTNVTTDANGDASIFVTLPVGVAAGTPITATATDPLGNTSEYSNCGFVGTNAISVSDQYFAWEPDGGTSIYVTRAAVPETATVDYAITDGTATSPADYTAVSGTLTFAACETSKIIPVTIVDDAIDEPDETATITFSNPTGGATLNRTTATLVIEDDDATPVVTIASSTPAMAENGGTATLTLSLDHPSSQDVTVDLAFGGTATAGSDYSGATTPVTIPATQTTATLTLTAIDDATYEGDETITAEITGATNATAGSPAVATVTITEDDPLPAITVGDVSAPEADGTVQFTITLSGPADVVTADFATNDGTATAPGDYVATSGQITFSPGVTTQTVTVTINDDLLFEPDETFTLHVTNAVNTSNGEASGTATILNDDAQADLSIAKSGPSSIEPNTPFDYVITVNNGGPGAATNVTVTDELPPSVVLDTVVASQGSCSGTSTVVCNLGTLANGASATITLTVHTTAPAGTITNTASVSADQSDPTPDNSGSSPAAAVAVVQVPALSEWMLIALAAMLALLAMRKV